MDYTQNLHLPQWEADDRIHHDDFNDAFAAIDAAVPRIVTGTYVGDGEASKFIDLGFTPRAVLVVDQHGRMNGENVMTQNQYWYGGLALAGYPAVAADNSVLAEITDGGFAVHSGYRSTHHYYYCANSGLHYYIAIG